MWAYKTDSFTDKNFNNNIIKSVIDQSLGDEAIKAMMISTVILTLVIGGDIYQHMKAFCIAVGLPTANRGETTFFHVFGGGLLACLSLC